MSKETINNHNLNYQRKIDKHRGKKVRLVINSSIVQFSFLQPFPKSLPSKRTVQMAAHQKYCNLN